MQSIRRIVLPFHLVSVFQIKSVLSSKLLNCCKRIAEYLRLQSPLWVEGTVQRQEVVHFLDLKYNMTSSLLIISYHVFICTMHFLAGLYWNYGSTCQPYLSICSLFRTWSPNRYINCLHQVLKAVTFQTGT